MKIRFLIDCVLNSLSVKMNRMSKRDDEFFSLISLLMMLCVKRKLYDLSRYVFFLFKEGHKIE